MKFFYIVNARIPTEKAHGIQIMKMCEAFANEDLEVELIVPNRKNQLKESPFEYYGITKNFTIRFLPTIDVVEWGKIGFLIQSLSFTIVSFLYACVRGKGIFYSRDEFSLFGLGLIRETHIEVLENRWNFFMKSSLRNAKTVFAITHGLKEFYVQKGVDAKKIHVAPDGVDIDQFKISFSKEQCREKTGLPQKKKIILYTGHLYRWKGVEVLAEASELLPEDVVVVFVGGLPKDVQRFRERHDKRNNVEVLGHKSYEMMPYFQRAADVLVIPNSAENDVSIKYTSPIKLFEYMASGIPIVASDLPSIREVLDEELAFLVTPDSVEMLAEGIRNALALGSEAETRGDNAQKRVESFTWSKRAQGIFSAIRENGVR